MIKLKNNIIYVYLLFSFITTYIPIHCSQNNQENNLLRDLAAIVASLADVFEGKDAEEILKNHGNKEAFWEAVAQKASQQNKTKLVSKIQNVMQQKNEQARDLNSLGDQISKSGNNLFPILGEEPFSILQHVFGKLLGDKSNLVPILRVVSPTKDLATIFEDQKKKKVVEYLGISEDVYNAFFNTADKEMLETSYMFFGNLGLSFALQLQRKNMIDRWFMIGLFANIAMSHGQYLYARIMSSNPIKQFNKEIIKSWQNDGIAAT